jgi:hypothetical protein
MLRVVKNYSTFMVSALFGEKITIGYYGKDRVLEFFKHWHDK